MMEEVTLSKPAGGKGPPKKDPTTLKTQRHTESQHKRAQDQRAQEIKETAPLNPTGILPSKYTP